MHAHYKPEAKKAVHGSKGKRMHGDNSMHGEGSSEMLYTGASTSSKHGNPKHIARDQYKMAPGHASMSSRRRLLEHSGSIYPGGEKK